MKRAKVMLITIVVIATVGGVLAFNAQKFIRQTIYCATKDDNNVIYCTNTSFKPTFLEINCLTTPCSTWHQVLGIPTNSYYTTTTNFVGTPCPNPLKVKCVTVQGDE